MGPIVNKSPHFHHSPHFSPYFHSRVVSLSIPPIHCTSGGNVLELSQLQRDHRIMGICSY